MAKKNQPPEGGYLFPRVARALRERAGIRAAEVARRLGVSDSSVAQYEHPGTAITEDTLRAYATALGLSLEDALCDGVALVRGQASERQQS